MPLPILVFKDLEIKIFAMDCLIWIQFYNSNYASGCTLQVIQQSALRTTPLYMCAFIYVLYCCMNTEFTERSHWDGLRFLLRRQRSQDKLPEALEAEKTELKNKLHNPSLRSLPLLSSFFYLP